MPPMVVQTVRIPTEQLKLAEQMVDGVVGVRLLAHQLVANQPALKLVLAIIQRHQVEEQIVPVQLLKTALPQRPALVVLP